MANLANIKQNPAPAHKMRARAALRKANISIRGLADKELISKALELDSELFADMTGDTKEEAPKAKEEAPKQPKAQEEAPKAKEEAPQAPQGGDTDAIADLQAALAKLVQPQAPVSEETLVKLIEQHATKTIAFKRFDKDQIVEIEGAHQQLEEIVAIMSCRTTDGARLQPYLYGPAGSGKTTLGAQAAKALGLDFYSTGAVLAPYELIGVLNAHGDYMETSLYNAFKHGGVMLFDEIDACSARALTAINQLLANDTYTFPNGEQVTKHHEFVAIAGANTKGHGATKGYNSRVQLDGATLDRFVPVEVTYDEALEKRLGLATFFANGGTEKDQASAIKVIERVQYERAQAKNAGIDAIISPRSTIQACAFVASLSINHALDLALYNKLTDDQRAQLGCK